MRDVVCSKNGQNCASEVWNLKEKVRVLEDENSKATDKVCKLEKRICYLEAKLRARDKSLDEFSVLFSRKLEELRAIDIEDD